MSRLVKKYDEYYNGAVMGGLWIIVHRYLDKLYIPGNGKRVQRYGLVLLLISIFFLIKTALFSALGIDVPFLFSLFIVIISAWFGGFGPGILATILSGTLTSYFFLEPKMTLFGSENAPNISVLIFFFIEGIFISILSESHRRSDVQKTEFLGVISHELKNPLTSMKGYTSLIRRLANKNGEQKLADYALRIDTQVNQVIEMINEMLDVTKIETGRLTYQDEKFAVSDLVQEIVSDQQVTSQKQKIQILGKSKKIVVGDRYRVGQVFVNLISNAIKYAPNAKRILVKMEDKRSSVLISVKDFGPGISRQDQTKLFNPYFRAKKTQSTKGTGIGLFISSQIVKHHGGKVWVQSRMGKGTTFFVSLPASS